MTDIEVQVQPTSNSPHGGPQLDRSGDRDSDCGESLHHTGQAEEEDPLSLLAVVALVPPCGDRTACSCDCETCSSSQEAWWMERSLQSVELQLHFLLSKADDLHDSLVNGQGHLEREALAAAVPGFLSTCQPFFNQLESLHTALPFDFYAKRVQLSDFSQQLCEKLEQLVLTYASYDLLCLDESKPHSVSHFCIGQNQLGPLRVTTFRYCEPTPYLAQVDTGLYKRMRWNVERLRDEEWTDEQSNDREAEIFSDTEYYFLCYEDIPNAHAEAGRDIQGVSHGNVVRMWSIGQWVQVIPDTEDIYDWIMHEVPQADYHRLLFLGSSEPSCSSATEYLQQLLLSHQTE